LAISRTLLRNIIGIQIFAVMGIRARLKTFTFHRASGRAGLARKSITRLVIRSRVFVRGRPRMPNNILRLTVPPGPKGGDGAASRRERPRITFARFLGALSSLNFFHRFSVRPLQQAAETTDPLNDAIGDYPNLDPRLRAFLALPHGDQRNHEVSNCFARNLNCSARVHGK
jgi:hypothetical protein